MKKLVSACLLFVCVPIFTVGCGGGTTQSTPEETFNGFKKAVSDDDWSTAFKYMTDESQDVFLGGIVMMSGMVVGFPEDRAKKESLDKLLKEHGIDTSDDKDPPENAGSLEDALASLVKDVKDKGACVKAIFAWMKENSTSENGGETPADSMKKQVFKEAKIEGDTATVTSTIDGKDEKPMIFTKKDGKWFIDLIASEKAKKN